MFLCSSNFISVILLFISPLSATPSLENETPLTNSLDFLFIDCYSNKEEVHESAALH